jgi:hypothetical protein
MEALKQPLPIEVPEVEIELITEERTCPGSADNAQNIQIPLKSKKTCQEENRLTLQKGPNKQYPVPVKLQVFLENLLDMHRQPLLYNLLYRKAAGDF